MTYRIGCRNRRIVGACAAGWGSPSMATVAAPTVDGATASRVKSIDHADGCKELSFVPAHLPFGRQRDRLEEWLGLSQYPKH